MKISIVMPAYNAEKYLSDTLFSVANQSYSNFELLLCDGGSTDKTIEIFRGFDDKRFNVVSTSDTGVPDALNKGFSAASGDCYCWLNADDVFLSRKTLEIVAQNVPEKFGFLYGNSKTLSSDGLISRHLVAHRPTQALAKFGANIFTGSLFFSSCAWRDFAGFSGNFRHAFEYEIIKFLFEYRYPPVVVNSYLSGFRVHDDALSSVFRSNLSRETKKILELEGEPSRLLWKAHKFGWLLLNGRVITLATGYINMKNSKRDSWLDLYEFTETGST